jgi:hypothetical protein
LPEKYLVLFPFRNHLVANLSAIIWLRKFFKKKLSVAKIGLVDRLGFVRFVSGLMFAWWLLCNDRL